MTREDKHSKYSHIEKIKKDMIELDFEYIKMLPDYDWKTPDFVYPGPD
jgi:hypothetical protein